MFTYKYTICSNLPKLAWLADINKTTREVSVLCGSRVECEDGFFVAGVWDGDFSEAGFDSSETFFGSGAKIIGDELRFYTAAHATERLVSYEDESSFVISNSVPFIMEYSGTELDESIDQYEAIFCSIIDGLNKMKSRIPMKGGKSISQHIVSVIRIDSELKVHVSRREAIKPFASFDDYYSRMMTTMKKLRQNSLSQDRKSGIYGIISTISSGYDSTACAVIAKELGCQSVASLSGGMYDTDDGADVAIQLGYETIIKVDKNQYKTRTDSIDAEYLCSGELGANMQFSVFEDAFADNLVFFGTRGTYWDKTSPLTDDYEMVGYWRFEASVSGTENALKNGYIFVPLPTYGSSVCTSIQKISASDEMELWSLGGSYDKPIPRRIVESAGVKRESFGQVKYGGGFCFCHDNMRRISSKMTDAGFKDFSEYKKSGKGIKKTLSRLIRIITYYLMLVPMIINRLAGKLGIELHLKQSPPRIANAGAPADLIFWGVDVMKVRYAKALAPYVCEKVK